MKGRTDKQQREGSRQSTSPESGQHLWCGYRGLTFGRLVDRLRAGLHASLGLSLPVITQLLDTHKHTDPFTHDKVKALYTVGDKLRI